MMGFYDNFIFERMVINYDTDSPKLCMPCLENYLGRDPYILRIKQQGYPYFNMAMV